MRPPGYEPGALPLRHSAFAPDWMKVLKLFKLYPLHFCVSCAFFKPGSHVYTRDAGDGNMMCGVDVNFHSAMTHPL